MFLQSQQRMAIKEVKLTSAYGIFLNIWAITGHILSVLAELQHSGYLHEYSNELRYPVITSKCTDPS